MGVGVSVGYSVYDSDNDGLRNYEEWTGETSFTDPDSDSDVLSDGEEVNEYVTGPQEPDSDGDGLEDGPKVNEYGTDPKDTDTDGDSYSRWNFKANMNDYREVNIYDTDPTSWDTDGDGLDNGEELYKGTSHTGGNLEPNPTYSEVVSFLESDTTDENEYVSREEEHPYVCEDFAATLGRNASDRDMRSGYVRLDFVEENPYSAHAIVAFDTVNGGLIFVETQTDEIHQDLNPGDSYWDYTIEEIDIYW